MDVNLAANVAFFVLILIFGLLVNKYLPGYIGEKAKNLATKEDIADITNKIEQVKVEYVKQIEIYKSDIWQSQQRYLQAQEEAKLKIEAFKSAVVDVAKITDLISIFHLHASNREMNGVIADMAFKQGNEKVQKDSWDMHLEHRSKAATLYSNFRELIVELGGTFALFSIYFEPELNDSLYKIIQMAHGAIDVKMSTAEFRDSLKDEFGKGHDLNKAMYNVGRYYDTLYDVRSITAESNHFFQLMRNHVMRSRT